MTQPTQSPSWLHLLSDQALADMSGPTVFERGLNYAASGLAETAGDVTLRPGAGRHRGNGAWQPAHAVRLWISADDELDGACTCPHAQDGNFCKHLVALALGAPRWAIAAAISLPQTARKQSSATQKSSVQTERQDALRRFIWEQMRLSWPNACGAGPNGIAYAWPTSRSGPVPARPSTIPRPCAPRSTPCCHDAMAISTGAGPTTMPARERRHGAAAAMVQRDAATARELCEHALRRLFKVAEQSDDSLGGIGGLIQDLMGLLIETLRTAAPPAPDRSVVQADGRGSLGRMNRPFEAAGPEAQAATRNAPARTGTVAAPAQDHVPALVISDQRRRSRTRLRRRYLEVLARQDDPRALLDAMIESVETAAEYCDVVAFCEARNWHREALGAVSRPAPPRDARCGGYCAAMNATAGMRKRWPSVANAWNITLAPCNTWRYFGPQKRETRSRSLSGRAVRMGGTTRTGETQACVGTTSAY